MGVELNMDKENLQSIKREIAVVLEYIYETKRGLINANGKLQEGVIVNGKSIGADKISEYISQLDMVFESLCKIREHCNQKIQIIEQNERLGFSQGNNIVLDPKEISLLNSIRGDM